MSAWRDERGFTLAELLTALAILGLILAAVLMVQQASFSAFLIGTNKTATQQNARVALERMARELRETTTGLTTATPTSITFTHPDLVAPNNTVTYTLVGTNLMRTVAGQPAQVFVAGVQTLLFTYFDANNTNPPPAPPGDIRRIDITIQTRAEDPSVPVGSAADTRVDATTTVRLRNLG